VGLLTGWAATSAPLKSVVLVLLLTSVMACAQQPPLRYLHDERPIDTAWGYRGSQARIDVTGRVAFSASTVLERDGGLLRTSVTLTNVSRDQIRLVYGGCPVQVQVFRDEARTGAPLFDSFRVPDRRCPAREVPRRLDALEDLRFTLLIRPEDVLGDAWPSGRYYVTAIVRPNGIRVEVPAGEVQLRRRHRDL
jgi:hypothetical protein